MAQLEERIRRRIKGSGDALERYKRKVYKLRRLVAGDFSEVLDSAAAAAQDGTEEGDLRINEFYDFIVLDFTDGHSNRLLQTIKQMMMQVAYTDPDVEFEDLDPLEAAVNAGWIKQRLAPAPVGCGARDAMKRSLLDFMIGGLGWSYVCLQRGTPAVDHCDTLDMSWDREAPHPSKMRWASCQFVQSLAQWIEQFGAKPFADEMGLDPANLDRRMALEFYYDLDTGEAGSMYVFKTGADGCYGDAVWSGPNPCTFDFGGKKLAFLPYTPIYFMALPSCKDPIGMVEMMFPDQLALWGIESYRRTARERGKPFFEVPDGALDPAEEKKFLDGEYGAAVKVKKGEIKPNPGLGVPRELNEEMGYYERQFIANSGVNPYANGTPVAGIEFASEVKEISGMSGLTVSYVSEDHAAWWRDSVRKFLAFGAAFDDQPIRIYIGNVPVQFGGLKPISTFLRPDADVVVSPDKMAFRPRAQRIAEAQRDLQTAMAVSAIFPGAVARAFEKYLRATGEKDIAGWMQQAAAPMAAPPQDPAMAGAAAAPMDAQASTV